MNDATTGQVSASAAEVYEEFFVPALFDQWPGRVLDRMGVGPGDRVLDVACGTGVVARAASSRVGTTGAVVGLDLNEGMLAVARRACPGVELRWGAAEQLPFDDASFDHVVCQFGLMFFEDRARAAREMARVLRPGGTVAVLTWASVHESPGYAAMVDLLRRLLGDRCADALLVPFSLPTPAHLSHALGDAFGAIDVRRLEGEARFASIRDWVRTDVLGWTLSGMVDRQQQALLENAAEHELARFAGAEGTVRFEAPAWLALARASDQPAVLSSGGRG